MKLNSKPSDIWKIISEVDTPETWIPFLDSRQVESNKHEKHLFFPTDLTLFCQELIAYKLKCIKPEERSVEFTLSVNNVDLTILTVVFEDKGASFIEVSANTPVSETELPAINEILLGLCAEIASNISFLASLKFPRVEYEQPSLDLPLRLKERYPEMSINSIKRVTAEEGLEEAIAGIYPVIISDYGSNFDHYSSIKNFSWWKKQFGPQTMFFMDYEKDALVNHILQPRLNGVTTFGNFVDMLESNPNESRFVAVDLAPHKLIGASKYVYPPTSLPEECSVVRHKIWMGTKHVYTPMHQDGSHTDFTGRGPEKFHNVNFQIAGRKHVILANPNQSRYLYPAPSALTFQGTPPHLRVDLHKTIDFDKFPLLKEAELYETVLNPGELIYIPRAWWHTFYALDNTINHNALFSSSTN
jgi:hypothetical protein